jgi:heme A synthase
VTSTTASLISFGCIFGGALAGTIVRSLLPERYFQDEAKDVLRLGLGLITTLSALVLGLLISTAKSSYDAKRSQVTQIATDVILVDRSLGLIWVGDKQRPACSP